jgi:CDP-diacylglycerol--serine O-phosphatidyltransferase
MVLQHPSNQPNHPTHHKFNIWWRLYKNRKPHLRRGLGLLPNLFTLGNAFFGFCSIVFTSEGDLIAGAYFIFFGALMDALDGRIARITGATSNFGLELDSLSDAVTFCLAPAFLIYQWELRYLEIFGVIACAFYLSMGLLRLARFNLTHTIQSTFFTGIPTPIGGCLLATLLFNAPNLPNIAPRPITLFFIIFLLGILMISPIRFPTFKHIKKKTFILVALVFFAFTVTMGFTNVLLFSFLLYFFIPIEEYIRHKISPSH